MSRQQQRARGRQQLSLRAARENRRGAEQRDCRRRGHREDAMRRPHHPAADVQRRAHDLVCLEPVEREDGADDVHNRVEGADLVEVDAVDRHLVNGSLGLGQPLEQRLGARLPGGRQRRAVDVRVDLREASVRMLPLAMSVVVVVRMDMTVRRLVAVAVPVTVLGRVVVPMRIRIVVRVAVRVNRLGMPLDQPELRRRHAGPEDALGRDLEVLNRQAAKRGLQRLQRQSCIQQRAEDHVARGAVEAVEVEDPHGLPGRRRKPETVIVAYRPGPIVRRPPVTSSTTAPSVRGS